MKVSDIGVDVIKEIWIVVRTVVNGVVVKEIWQDVKAEIRKRKEKIS